MSKSTTNINENTIFKRRNTNSYNQLENNKSAGRNGMEAEFLKFEKEELAKEIAVILNEIASARIYPREVAEGMITAIQKPAKPKEPVENLVTIT